MTNIGNAPLAVSIEQAAARVGIGRTSLIKELRTGRLRSIKMGKRTLIAVRDLEEWFATLPTREAVCKQDRQA